MTAQGPYPLDAIHVSASEAYALVGVRPDLLRQWVHRGHVLKAGRDSYDLGSVMNTLAARNNDDLEETTL